jgi:V/A-type H+-transporting ATPase subunit G/H
MSVEAIKNIKAVEEKAQQLLQETKDAVKKLLADASEEAEKIAEESIKLTEKNVASILLEAKNAAQKDYDLILSKTAQECEKLKTDSEGNLERASDIIFGRVVKV